MVILIYGGELMDNNNDNRDRNRERTENRTNDWSIGELLIRLLVTAIVVGIAAFVTPGFTIDNLWSLLLAAAVIAVLDYLIQRFTGVNATPFGRGITGFIVAAIILYATRFIVPGFEISMWGAIIGALVIGIIDVIMPGRAM